MDRSMDVDLLFPYFSTVLVPVCYIDVVKYKTCKVDGCFIQLRVQSVGQCGRGTFLFLFCQTSERERKRRKKPMLECHCWDGGFFLPRSGWDRSTEETDEWGRRNGLPPNVMEYKRLSGTPNTHLPHSLSLPMTCEFGLSRGAPFEMAGLVGSSGGKKARVPE